MWKCELNEWNFIRFIPLAKDSGRGSLWEIHLAYERPKRKTASAHTDRHINRETTRQTDRQTDRETNKPSDIISPKQMLWFQFQKEPTMHKVFPFSSSRGKSRQAESHIESSGRVKSSLKYIHTYIFSICVWSSRTLHDTRVCVCEGDKT